MVDPREVAARYDRVAAGYDRGGVHAWLARQVAALAASIEANQILDVGTGTGQVIEAMIANGCRAGFTGEELLLTDGGLTDWTARLLNNRKERLAISGLGTERLITQFR
jgi:ubiquinone/menaquinone biosynthesis C-methylase UbiE